MNIQQRVTPYEILFRLNPDGTIAGCHKRELETIVDVDSGVVYATKELDPAAITGQYVNTVLGTVNSSLVLTLTERDAQLAQATEVLEIVQRDLGTAGASIAELQAEVAGLHEVLSTTVAQLQDAEVLIQELQAAAASEAEAPAEPTPTEEIP